MNYNEKKNTEKNDKYKIPPRLKYFVSVLVVATMNIFTQFAVDVCDCDGIVAGKTKGGQFIYSFETFFEQTSA